jgi:hypothetical protein
MLTLNYTAVVNRWAIVGNSVLWILGQDIVLDETPLDDLPDEVRAVVLAKDHERPHFCLELFGVMTVMPNQAATDPESHPET